MTESHAKASSLEQQLDLAVLRKNLPRLNDAIALLLRFKSTLIQEFKGIEQGFEQDDLKTVQFYTHRLRSGSLYLGLEGLAYAAACLEEHIDKKSPKGDIMGAWSDLREACLQFLTYDQADFIAFLTEIGENQGLPASQ